MSVMDAVPAFPYHDPWAIGLPERMQMLSRGKKSVAYFYEAYDNSTFRYRIYNMVQVLNESPEDISASFFFLSDLAALNEIADKADILVICRARYDGRINQLINAFHKRGKKVIFDVDDLVFNVDYAQLTLRTLNINTDTPSAWDNWFAYCSRIGATLKQCDAAITTNEFLAEQIRLFSGLPTQIVPNFMNKEQLDISTKIFEVKRHMKPASEGIIRLGYFSGSPSHVNDFQLTVPALESVMAKMPHVRLVIAGFINADSLRQHFPSPRIVHYPFCDFVNLQRLVSSVEFNLVPLQFNTFTNCKSQLKYFEAAVVGTQTIASPTYTYAHSIRDGDNGYLAKAHQWDTKIEQAIEELSDYRDMAERAREDALLHFAWYNQRDTIVKALWG